MARFIEVEKYILNLDHVAYIETGNDSSGNYILVHLLGEITEPLRIDGKNGTNLLKTLNAQSVDRFDQRVITHSGSVH
jgi:hypothetical protein